MGVLGTLVALAVSLPLGALAALLAIRALRLVRRATRRWHTPVRAGEWAMSAALAFSHGANDAQKSVGVIAALLLADGRIDTLAAPTWAKLACAVALTAGTALGGWRIIRTVGRRIYRIKPIEGLASQTASASVIFGASVVGAPVSTTQVVASSVVGVGGGRRRWHHVHWEVVREMGLAWFITMPVTAALAASLSGSGGWWHESAAAVVPAGHARRARDAAPPACGDDRRVGAFQAWAAGDAGAAEAVLGTERRGEAAKREVLRALRAAFVTPLEPEDVFALSRGVDRILNSARDLVKESEAMDCPPDAGIAEMARLLGAALRHIDDAIARLGSDGDAAAASADAAITTERQLQRAYYEGMAGLLEVGDRSERIARRELYRRCSRIGETVVEVAERVVYAVVKQS